MRKIKKVHDASYAPIADLVTYTPLPSRTLDQIDPFLFLNHHGYQEYPPNNTGLPFGPHPHRGMETVTFIVEGDIMHKDSAGHQSVIRAGGVQWMTAGKGLVHAEVSSDEFKKEGGKLEILQLWINLPAKSKMTEPRYIGLQETDIPKVAMDEGSATVRVISGKWGTQKGPVESLTGVSIFTIELRAEGRLTREVAATENVFFYIVRGAVNVNGTEAKKRQLVEFENAGTSIQIAAAEESLIIFCHAAPLNEPVVARGPFVMNTQEEILQAYEDYNAGKFGLWNE
ncbi:MAG TPA: pirin family protein [Chryseosolibacter sp.]|nr:pirin family protein [Chryseosolibacter sp.]